MEEKEILDEKGIKRSLMRIAHEIIEHNKGIENLILVGIQTRGEFLAKRLAVALLMVEDIEVPCYSLNIHPWRDDIEEKKSPITTPPFSVSQKKVILVDDVLFNGRTIRAAMDAIMSFGRAEEIQLAVLVDRGHRRLPIRADYVGKNIPSSLHETIHVKVREVDGVNGVFIGKESL